MTQDDEHIGAVEEMLVGLKNNAPDNHGFAELHEAVGSPEVFGLASCWRNLNRNSCVLCLANAYDSVYKCLPATEGRVANTGCFIHYSDYKFANDVQDQATRGLLILFALMYY